ncbi:MAG: TRAP transporter small permease [Bacillota bacterium]
MVKKLKAVSDFLDTVSLRIAAVMIGIILALTVIGAISRYVFSSALSWPMPVSQILMIWSALLGIPAALKRGEHMGVSALLEALPDKGEMILNYLNYLLILLFTLILVWFGWREVIRTGDTYMITRNFKISFRWLAAAIPASGIIQITHLLTMPYLIAEAKRKSESMEGVE